MDKSQVGKESIFRIEIWTKFADDKEDCAKQIRDYIDRTFIAGIMEEAKDPNYKLNGTKFVTHQKQPAHGGPKGGNRAPKQ